MNHDVTSQYVTSTQIKRFFNNEKKIVQNQSIKQNTLPHFPYDRYRLID